MWVNVGQMPAKLSPQEKNHGEAEIQSSGLPGAMEAEQGEFLSSVVGLFALGYPWVILVACRVPWGVRQRTEPQSMMGKG